MSPDALPIEKSVALNLQYPSVSDRYFTHYYFIPKNPNKKSMIKWNDEINCTSQSQSVHSDDLSSDTLFRLKGEDTCVMMHSNRICIITLSPKHPILMEKKSITKVDFSVGGIDRLANKVSGKGKRGAQIVGLFSPLCCLHCADGSSHMVYCGVRGKLVEVNDRLLNNPNLICEAPKAEGYLAIVLPKLDQGDNLKELLLTSDQYEQLYARNIT